jgi:hypothetical protein
MKDFLRFPSPLSYPPPWQGGETLLSTYWVVETIFPFPKPNTGEDAATHSLPSILSPSFVKEGPGEVSSAVRLFYQKIPED